MSFRYVIDGQYKNCGGAYYVVDGVYKNVASAFYTVDGVHRLVFDASGGGSSERNRYYVSLGYSSDSILGTTNEYGLWLHIEYVDGNRYGELSEDELIRPGATVQVTCLDGGDIDILRSQNTFEWRIYDESGTNYDVFSTDYYGSFTMPGYDAKVELRIRYSGGGSNVTYYDIYYHGSAFTDTPQTSAYYGQDVRFEANAVDGNDFTIYGLRTGNSYGSPYTMHSGAYYLFTMPDESVEVVYTKD